MDPLRLSETVSMLCKSKAFVVGACAGLFSGFQTKRDDHGCVVVTEKNFHGTVIGNNNNVLVIYYTSDVPPFMKYSDIQEDNNPPHTVLKSLANEYSNSDSHVTIARCNVADYDVPVRIYNIPTIKLYPSGRKRLPVEYFGRKDSLEQYKHFIENESPQDTRFKPVSRRNSPNAHQAARKAGGENVNSNQESR